MQLNYRKFKMIVIVGLFIFQIVTGNHLGSLDTLYSERSNEDLFDLDVRSDNSMNDQSAELHSKNHRKSKEWVNLTMTQRSYLHSTGQSYELKCEAAGSPAPDIYWIHENDIRKQINKIKRWTRAHYLLNSQEPDMAKVESKYIVNCATKAAGINRIYCVAVSGEFIEQRSAIVGIDGPCSTALNPIITKYKPILLSVQGSTVILPCDVYGDPKPYISWRIGSDNDIIDPRSNSRIEILRNGGLMIKSLEWNDVGEYTCIANSTLGEDQATTFVYPLKPAI